MDHLFLLIPKQEEASELFPAFTTLEVQTEAALEQNVEDVIITLGAKDSFYDNRNVSCLCPAMDFPCVDATAVSNIIISYLASQSSKVSDIDTAIKPSTITAFHSISKMGVQNAIIDSNTMLVLFERDYSLSASLKNQALFFLYSNCPHLLSKMLNIDLS